MIITLIILTAIGFFPSVWNAATAEYFTPAVLKWISVIAMVYAMVIMYNLGEKEACINCLNNKCKYEKRYISNDTGVIDSTYIKIK